jgi:membrane protease YdiL (CAAX protease family)
VNNNTNKLKKMATWTIAIFATIFAVVMAVLWIQLYGSGSPAISALGQALAAGWVMILIALVLCAGTYIGYSIYINRKK